MDPAFLGILKCPSCNGGPIGRQGAQPFCTACGFELTRQSGYFDLLDIASRGEPTASSSEQRLMESELVARVYDRVWRPAFVRVMGGKGAGAATGGFPGEFYIHKASLGIEDRPGPWLDLSCGPGLFTRAFAAAAPGSLVVGLDISKAMLTTAATRIHGYTNAQLIRGDAHDLPFVDGAFGGVNNAGALHVYDDSEQVFREVWRVLTPGGVFVGSTFSRETSVLGRVASRLAGIRRFDPPELRAWLSRVGFADYEEIKLGGAFIFRVRKP